MWGGEREKREKEQNGKRMNETINREIQIVKLIKKYSVRNRKYGQEIE